MKTSFYFVVWILVYPFLRLFNNPFINNNSFIIAFIGVWIFASFINKTMPKIISYEFKIKGLPMMEEIYTGNIALFARRLNRDTLIETITAVYFILSTLMIAISMLIYRSFDWIALIIFIFLAVSVGQRAASYIRASNELKADPTANRCAAIAGNLYRQSYSAFYQTRVRQSYASMFLPVPRNFGIFRVFSMCMALICGLLGLLSVTTSIISFFDNGSFHLGDFVSSIMIIYGSLAIYYGIKDFISSLQSVPK